MNSLIKYILLFSLQLFVSCSQNEYFLPQLTLTLQNIINESLSSLIQPISDSCNISLHNTFLSPITTANSYAQRTIEHSSKNKNDFLTYSSCMRSQPSLQNTPNYLFTTLTFNDSSHFDYPQRYSIGICVPSQCNETDYTTLIQSIVVNHNELFDLKINNTWNLTLFEVNSYDKKFAFTPIQLLTLIPLLLIVIQLILNIVPFIPYWLSLKLLQLIKLCNKQRNTSVLLKTSTLKKSLLQIKKAFSLGENSEELFNSRKQSSKINNETGLTYIKVLRCISMMFFLFGTVFTMIIQSPSHIKSETSLHNLMINYLYSLIFFGIRYAPRILLSCSGFTLTYKLFCYLDEQIEENDADDSEDGDSHGNSSSNTNTNSARTYSELIKIEKEKLKKSTNIRVSNVVSKPRFIDGDVLFKYVFTFMKYQLHKYIIAFIIIYFMKWSLYSVFIVFDGSSSPLREYYNQRIIKQSTRTLSIITQLLCIRPFFFVHIGTDDNDVYTLNDVDVFYDYYWLIFNEMVFFVFTAVIIWINYKEKYSLNHFCFLCGLFIIVVRFVIVFYNHFEVLHYFSHLGYGLYFINPLNNYVYYLIGVYFGLINYAYQKNITLDECEETQRFYLMNTIRYINGQQKKTLISNYIMGIVILLCTLLLSLSQIIILRCTGKEFISYSIPLQIAYCVDIEVVIYFVHRIMFSLYLKGNNIVHAVACSRKWELWNKLYFCFILSLPSVVLFFLYQSDNKITLEFFTLLYYSLNIFVFTTIVACLLYVVFELPYKRVIKFWLNMKENGLSQNHMIELNSSSLYQGEFNLYGNDDDDKDEDDDDNDNDNANVNVDKLLLNNLV